MTDVKQRTTNDNIRRSIRALNALGLLNDCLFDSSPGALQENIIDSITDLLHLAEQNKINAQVTAGIAVEHFLNETLSISE